MIVVLPAAALGWTFARLAGRWTVPLLILLTAAAALQPLVGEYFEARRKLESILAHAPAAELRGKLVNWSDLDRVAFARFRAELGERWPTLLLGFALSAVSCFQSARMTLTLKPITAAPSEAQ
jgi:hypothetical protein